MLDDIGFSLTGQNNGLHFFYGAVAPACSSCALVDDPGWLHPTIRMRRRRMDFSTTYDGKTIVSDRFRSFVADEPGIGFVPLPNDPEFFVPESNVLVAFDAAARGTTFQFVCDVCMRPTVIVGAEPIILMPGVELQNGFSRTDRVFGSATGRSESPALQKPKLLVSPGLGRRLLAERFVGLEMEPLVTEMPTFD